MGCVSQSSNSQFLVNTCTVIDLLNKSPLGEYFLCIKKCPVQKSGSGIRYIFRSMSGSVQLKIYGSNRSLQILNIKPFEGAQKNPHWRKTIQLLTVILQMLNVCVGTSYKDI